MSLEIKVGLQYLHEFECYELLLHIISYVALFDFMLQMIGYLYSLSEKKKEFNYMCILMQDIIIYYDLYCLDLSNDLSRSS